MTTPVEAAARLRKRRAALLRHAAEWAAPAQALAAEQARRLDAQIAAYEAAANRLAELEELTAALRARADVAAQLAAAGVDLPALLAGMQRMAEGGAAWPAPAAATLARLRKALGLPAECEIAWVEHVMDGDSIRLRDGREVRYIGIDASEMRDVFAQPEPFAREAGDLNARLTAGRQVRLEREASECDRYGRLLRHVYVGQMWVAGELVGRGLAVARPVPPDTRRADALDALQRAAQLAGRGMWS